MIVRPQPRFGVYEQPFWEFVTARQLRLQCCDSCGTFWYPPGPACPSCLSRDYQWLPVTGRGHLLSWVVFHRQYFDSIEPPYTIVAVELSEGPILIADSIDPGEKLSLGAPMALDYTEAQSAEGAPFTLYQWRLATTHTEKVRA